MADGPLSGVTVAVTRPEHDAEPLAEALRGLGAKALVLPLVRIEPLSPALGALERYDWVVFTSATGVRAVRGALGRAGWPSGVRIAAVGPATAAEVEKLGVEPAFVPDTFTGEALATGLEPVQGTAILLPQADIADPGVAEALRERGAAVTAVAAYRTVGLTLPVDELDALRAADAVVLASGSAARSLAAQGGAGEALVACIGPKTAEVATAVGLPVGLVAGEATSEGIIQALMSHFARTR